MNTYYKKDIPEHLQKYFCPAELGLEPTFQEYITKLCDIFDEVKRVLKKEGTCWVNLGDTYSGNKEGKTDNKVSQYLKDTTTNLHKKATITEKCLCQIPSRFAIEMTNRGWILRNEIIWHKPNCMPSSVKDRFTVDFEKIFFFVKSKKYWFEQLRAPYGKDEREAGLQRARKYGYSGKGTYQDWYNNERKKTDWVAGNKNLKEGMYASRGQSENKPPLLHPDGRNKRAVWSIITKPYSEAHFATYPEKLIEPMIKAGCPEGGIVLDPFIGSGTTAVVAKKLKRNWIGIELNKDYIEIANKRINAIPEAML